MPAAQIRHRHHARLHGINHAIRRRPQLVDETGRQKSLYDGGHRPTLLKAVALYASSHFIGYRRTRILPRFGVIPIELRLHFFEATLEIGTMLKLREIARAARTVIDSVLYEIFAVSLDASTRERTRANTC